MSTTQHQMVGAKPVLEQLSILMEMFCAVNRDEGDGDKGSMAHVGLLENAICVDRNGDGIITTSADLGDVKALDQCTGD